MAERWRFSSLQLLRCVAASVTDDLQRGAARGHSRQVVYINAAGESGAPVAAGKSVRLPDLPEAVPTIMWSTQCLHGAKRAQSTPRAGGAVESTPRRHVCA